MFGRSLLLGLIAALEFARADVIITYPLWRGNNLMHNGSIPTADPAAMAVQYDATGASSGNSSTSGVTFPFGMPFTYPCGGLPVTTNRTLWPVGGGAVSFGPGYGQGFKASFVYINIGRTDFGDLAPANYSHALAPPLALTGKNDSYWPGQVCIPQVGMPAGIDWEVGNNATIQVVQISVTGEAVYSCADVTLAPNGDPRIANITAQNCYNSTDIAIAQVFTTTALSAAPHTVAMATPWMVVGLAVLTGLWSLV